VSDSHAAGSWHRRTAIRVLADADTLFNLLAGVELWPAIFRHIESVRVLRRDGPKRLIEVRARWNGLPLGYRAVVTSDARRREFTIRHVSALTRGSIATWAVEPVHDQSGQPVQAELHVGVHVVVPLPGIGPFLARQFAGGLVARDLGSAMMYRLKEIAEGASLAGPE
jgi:hypothetical protein